MLKAAIINKQFDVFTMRGRLMKSALLYISIGQLPFHGSDVSVDMSLVSYDTYFRYNSVIFTACSILYLTLWRIIVRIIRDAKGQHFVSFFSILIKAIKIFYLQ